jgi:hypothetical protein
LIGTLGLDPATLFLVLPADVSPAAGSGVARLSLPLTPNPALVGLTAFVQGANVIGDVATLSDWVVRAQVL